MKRQFKRQFLEPTELLMHAADLIESSIEKLSQFREIGDGDSDIDFLDMQYTALHLRSLSAYVQPPVDAMY